jgi:hypothetical protein
MNDPPSRTRGRRECRAPGAPAASCAKVESTRVRNHGHAGITRHSPRNGFTVSFALSPVTGLVCHRRLAEFTSAKLDTSVGASGPHDFAVRGSVSIVADTARVHRLPHPTSVTIAQTPLLRGTGWAESAGDLGVRSMTPTRGQLARRANQRAKCLAKKRDQLIALCNRSGATFLPSPLVGEGVHRRPLAAVLYRTPMLCIGYAKFATDEGLSPRRQTPHPSSRCEATLSRRRLSGT